MKLDRFKLLSSPATIANINGISAACIAYVRRQIVVVEEAMTKKPLPAHVAEYGREQLRQRRQWADDVEKLLGNGDDIRALLMTAMKDFAAPERSHWADSNSRCFYTGEQVDQLCIEQGVLMPNPKEVAFTPYVGRQYNFVTMFFVDDTLSPDKEDNVVSVWYPDIMDAPFRWEVAHQSAAEDGQHRSVLRGLLSGECR